MSQSPVRTVVLARNLAEFHAWCQETGTSPRDRTVLYAAGPHTLRGLHGAKVIRHGMWWDRIDEAVLTKAVAALEGRNSAATTPA